MNTWPKGSVVRITGTFKDIDGVVMDPAAVLFSFFAPGNETTTPTDTYTYLTDPELVKLSTGVYAVDLDADLEGLYHYRFNSTGVGKAAEEGFFRVRHTRF